MTGGPRPDTVPWIEGACNLRWVYNPGPRYRPPHAEHGCGQRAGHAGDHLCARCACWLTPEDAATSLYVVPEEEGR